MTVNEIFEDQTFQQYLRDGLKRVSNAVYDTLFSALFLQHPPNYLIISIAFAFLGVARIFLCM